MARETFNVCDRCAAREKQSPTELDTIGLVTVYIGTDKITKDLCHRCCTELKEWMDDQIPSPVTRRG